MASRKKRSRRSPRRPPPPAVEEKKLPAERPPARGFDPRDLDRTVIAIPLLRRMAAADADASFDLVIDLNLNHEQGLAGARRRVEAMLKQVAGARRRQRNQVSAASEGFQYVFASLRADQVRKLAALDRRHGKGNSTKTAIFRIWPDFEVRALITKSRSTVKADAAQNSFAAFGQDIVWAVVDSGIDATHPHFALHKNLDLPAPLRHRDFTAAPERPLADAHGHGTHVAGIIAGELTGKRKVVAVTHQRDENGETSTSEHRLDAIAGMAPRCKLMSLKVLDAEGEGDGTGKTSAIISALNYVQEVNGWGRRLLVHGVNLSLGYPFDPEWFACGQSPLCVEIERLVKNGVVVVVAAGNSGYGYVNSAMAADAEVTPVSAGLDLTIDDPGNAELAITVGSTHRDMPHTYGVSYFSSKGPTGDGRMKPDLLAPGERILSCASNGRRSGRSGRGGRYAEESGTSMAAPHVSGVIAAFLSIRREFIQRPEEVKRIFLATATDLGRARNFQGHGLVDLMRAIQSV